MVSNNWKSVKIEFVPIQKWAVIVKGLDQL